MSWSLVPLAFRPIGFFDRQRDLFPDWTHAFDDDWAALDLAASRSRFDQELERIRKDLFPLDSHPEPQQLTVDQPFITDANGEKKLSLRFDVSGFKPEEITVKTLDDKLRVHAKHEEEGPGRKVYREFTREFALPKNVDPKALKSTLSKDNVLQIEAPAPESIKEAPKENLVPIDKL